MTAEVPRLVPTYDPCLWTPARRLAVEEIGSAAALEVVDKLRRVSAADPFSVGVSAPQIGEGVAISLISEKPTPTTPYNESYQKVMFNPVVRDIDRPAMVWEGCMSFGSGSDMLYAMVKNFLHVEVGYYGLDAEWHEEEHFNLRAQIDKHESRHNDGTPFVKYADPLTFMTAGNYRLLRYGGLVRLPWEQAPPHSMDNIKEPTLPQVRGLLAQVQHATPPDILEAFDNRYGLAA